MSMVKEAPWGKVYGDNYVVKTAWGKWLRGKLLRTLFSYLFTNISANVKVLLLGLKLVLLQFWPFWNKFVDIMLAIWIVKNQNKKEFDSKKKLLNFLFFKIYLEFKKKHNSIKCVCLFKSRWWRHVIRFNSIQWRGPVSQNKIWHFWGFNCIW